MIFLDYIKNEDIGKICLCCMKRKKKLHTIKIEPMSYGSLFDDFGTELYLCDSCYNAAPLPLKKLSVVDDSELLKMGFSCKQYEKEDEILTYLESLPRAARELIFNRNKITLLFPQKVIDPQVFLNTLK